VPTPFADSDHEKLDLEIGLKTSRIRFWAFSYSMAEPCGRSNQLMMYFNGALLH